MAFRDLLQPFNEAIVGRYGLLDHERRDPDYFPPPPSGEPGGMHRTPFSVPDREKKQTTKTDKRLYGKPSRSRAQRVLKPLTN
jgi:hypothetical protein